MEKDKPGTRNNGERGKGKSREVFSWEGIVYTRKWTGAESGHSDEQVKIRQAFSRCINAWSLLPEAVKLGWNYHAMGKPFTGCNMFFLANFNAMKKECQLELSRGNGINAPVNLSAAIDDAGEISVFFEMKNDAVQVTLFVQDFSAPENGRLFTTWPDVAGGTMPVVLPGFDPQGKYNVYAVASSGSLEEAVKVSGSAVCKVVK